MKEKWHPKKDGSKIEFLEEAMKDMKDSKLVVMPDSISCKRLDISGPIFEAITFLNNLLREHAEHDHLGSDAISSINESLERLCEQLVIKMESPMFLMKTDFED